MISHQSLDCSSQGKDSNRVPISTEISAASEKTLLTLRKSVILQSFSPQVNNYEDMVNLETRFATSRAGSFP